MARATENPKTFWRRGDEEIEVEGVTVRVDSSIMAWDFESGDLYVAERNIGPKLLTFVELRNDAGVWDGGRADSNGGKWSPWVVCEEKAYHYDPHECRKVTHIDGEPV